MPSAIMPPGSVFNLAGVKAYDTTYPGFNRDPVPAYVARPAAEGSHPGLLLVHGIHGHEEHMKDVARRFAVLGYASIVPALYSRDEFLSVVEEEDLAKAGSWLRNRTNAQTIGDLEGALTVLRDSPHVNGRIGLVGFCSGGRLALVFACNTRGLDAFVNFYSNAIFQSTETNPTPPAEMVKDLCCPMLGLFGDEDSNPSPGDVARLRGALESSSKVFETASYRGAGHAFFSDTRPSYHAEAAYMAWGRCLEWLSRYLKA